MTDGIIVGVNESPASIDALRCVADSHIAIALGLNLSVVAAWNYETPISRQLRPPRDHGQFGTNDAWEVLDEASIR